MLIFIGIFREPNINLEMGRLGIRLISDIPTSIPLYETMWLRIIFL